MEMKHRLTLLLLLLAAGAQIASPQMNQSTEHKSNREIVFVCEHGAALSVVSAAYFNKLARGQHLDLHAVARGTDPQHDLAISARDGLNADGVPFDRRRPQKLSPREAAQARRIITFVSLPAEYSALAPVETWNDVPPTGEGYGPARDAIVAHLRKLIREMKSGEEKQQSKQR
jgi:arsenate reductase (thioredoxin)